LPRTNHISSLSSSQISGFFPRQTGGGPPSLATLHASHKPRNFARGLFKIMAQIPSQYAEPIIYYRYNEV